MVVTGEFDGENQRGVLELPGEEGEGRHRGRQRQGQVGPVRGDAG